jgi:hypothetical protein
MGQLAAWSGRRAGRRWLMSRVRGRVAQSHDGVSGRGHTRLPTRSVVGPLGPSDGALVHHPS